MTEVALRAEGLSKRYRIGVEEERHEHLASTIGAWLSAPVRSFRRLRNLTHFADDEASDVVWALRDVSFSVGRGEVLGIIGRNGAGKSTLLKIMSNITEPTAGRVLVSGRVASLLEVGTGFHPELTGRENVYLNGTILGMRKDEVSRKFDEIVDFSGVEKFIDTPVKWYSSGMKVRLAFAVAAHLDPEVLLVDEVLAVGDANFQRKCLSKMEDVRGQGRTVCFISHNMDSITRLCPRAILLDGGRIIQDGAAQDVVQDYLATGLGATSSKEWPWANAPGDEVVKLLSVRAWSGSESRVRDGGFHVREAVSVEMEYEVLEDGHSLTPNFHFYNESGVHLFMSGEQNEEAHSARLSRGRFVSTVTLPGDLLNEGTVLVGAAISTINPVKVHVYEREVVAFQLTDRMGSGSTRGEYMGRTPGVIRPRLPWKTEATGQAAVSE